MVDDNGNMDTDAPKMPEGKISLPAFDDGNEDSESWYNPEQVREEISSSGQIADYADLESIHTQMNAARLSLYRTVMEQSQTDRDLAVAEQKYKRRWNRLYLSARGTEKIRTTLADVNSERLQNQYIQLQVKSRELVRRAQFLRDEIKALESLSNDYRQLIRSTT